MNQSESEKTKFIECCDCGEWFEVSVKDIGTCRCNKCNIKHKKELRRLAMQRYRERNNM